MSPKHWTRALFAAVLLSSASSCLSLAQDKDSKPTEKSAEVAPAPPPKEESSVTDHTIKLGGQTAPDKATAGTTLLRSDKDEPEA